MKRLIYIFLLIVLSTNTFAQDTLSVKYGLKNWDYQFVNNNNLYPTYLADPLAPRFEGAIQNVKYSDISYEDEINNGGDYSNRIYIIAGSKMTLFSFINKQKPDMAFGFEIAASFPLYMEAAGFDFMGVDGIFHFAITGQLNKYLNFRLAKHHICTHRGDEYTTGIVTTPVDFDPNIETLYVRDDYMISLAYKPLVHFIHENFNFFQVYGDFLFFWPGKDFLGERQNKPERYAYLGFQGGAELEYYFHNTKLGGVFSAFNISSYQANGYSTNINLVGGYILPQQRNKKKVRFGLQYYDGRGLLNEFYNRHDKFVSFFFGMNI